MAGKCWFEDSKGRHCKDHKEPLHLDVGLNHIHPPMSRTLPGAAPASHRDPRTQPTPSETELPSHLHHHTKSQAVGQKTQLFSAVTLLNLIFPMSSLSYSSRMKCVFGLCHKTLHFVKAIHLAAAICNCMLAPRRSGGFYISSGKRGQKSGALCTVRWGWWADST